MHHYLLGCSRFKTNLCTMQSLIYFTKQKIPANNFYKLLWEQTVTNRSGVFLMLHVNSYGTVNPFNIIRHVYQIDMALDSTQIPTKNNFDKCQTKALMVSERHLHGQVFKHKTKTEKKVMNLWNKRASLMSICLLTDFHVISISRLQKPSMMISSCTCEILNVRYDCSWESLSSVFASLLPLNYWR